MPKATSGANIGDTADTFDLDQRWSTRQRIQSLVNTVNLVASGIGLGQASYSSQLATLFTTALKSNLQALQSLAS